MQVNSTNSLINGQQVQQPQLVDSDAAKNNQTSIKSRLSAFKHYIQVNILKKSSYDLAAARQHPISSVSRPAVTLISTKSSEDIEKSTQNAQNIHQLVELHVQAAHDVLSTLPMHAFKEKSTAQALNNMFNDFKQQYPVVGLATKEQKHAAKQVRKQMENLLFEVAPVGKNAKKVVKQELQEAIAQRLNKIEERWLPINKSIEWKGNTYKSEMNPAAHLPSLESSYKASGVSGISSMATSESNHAVNLWVSEFNADKRTGSAGDVSFKGLRHGVNTPFAEKDPVKRQKGADKRTLEVITAALDMKKDQLITHLRSAGPAGKPFILKLTSTSLLTPSQYFGSHAYKERQFVNEQLAAWQRAGDGPKNVEVDVNGTLKTVNVQLDVLAFNFGVNGGAKLVSKLPNAVALADKLSQSDITGWKMADKVNQDGLSRLLNWAINYKDTCENEPKKQRIQTYINNITELQSSNKHHHDGDRAYALPEQVVLLSNEIDVLPAWNCMSGKDRTGLLDAEVKQSLIEQSLNGGQVADFSLAMTGERQQLHDKVLLESGNHEIQQANTGVAGYKIFEGGKIAVASNATNISDQNRPEVRGLSGAVSA